MQFISNTACNNKIHSNKDKSIVLFLLVLVLYCLSVNLNILQWVIHPGLADQNLSIGGPVPNLCGTDPFPQGIYPRKTAGWTNRQIHFDLQDFVAFEAATLLFPEYN